MIDDVAGGKLLLAMYRLTKAIIKHENAPSFILAPPVNGAKRVSHRGGPAGRSKWMVDCLAALPFAPFSSFLFVQPLLHAQLRSLSSSSSSSLSTLSMWLHSRRTG